MIADRVNLLLVTSSELAPDEASLLDVAVRAARAAGAELLSRFGSAPEDVRAKSTPTDPVSAADLAAEEAIRDLFGAERPEDAVLGEEGGEVAGAGGDGGGGDGRDVARGMGGLRWIVDPLDGTVNYLYGIPQFAVSVACEDGDGTIVGAVLDPVRDILYTATRSGPPQRDGRPIAASSCDSLAAALVGTGFGYEAAVRRAQARVVSAVLPRARDIRRAGAAALDLCACACGQLDAYYERGVKPWDIAAGALLCERAGLAVRMLPPVGAPAESEEADLPAGILVAPAGLIDELEALVGG